MAQNNTKDYNLSCIEEVALGNKEIRNEIITIFIEDSITYVNNLGKYLEEKNWEQISYDSHGYYSQIAMISSQKKTLEKIERLEILCKKQNNIKEIYVIIETLKIEIEKFIVILNADFSLNLI